MDGEQNCWEGTFWGAFSCYCFPDKAILAHAGARLLGLEGEEEDALEIWYLGLPRRLGQAARGSCRKSHLLLKTVEVYLVFVRFRRIIGIAFGYLSIRPGWSTHRSWQLSFSSWTSNALAGKCHKCI